ncbi:hypothetical protein GCM10020331_004540 [Ectobacillus funiculus]
MKKTNIFFRSSKGIGGWVCPHYYIGCIFLLTLPIATTNGEGLPWLDALFTSTSATCVTGLVVVDTGTTFTLFGQLVILSLIQVGGLGFMTFATFCFYFREENFFEGTVVITRSLKQLICCRYCSPSKKRILIFFTLVIELVGAIFIIYSLCV